MFAFFNQVLSTYHYHISEEDWANAVQKQSYYPQLNAVSDIFELFNIRHMIAKVPFEYFDQLPDNFLCILNDHGVPQTVWIQEKYDSTVSVRFMNNSVEELSLIEIGQLWSEFILLLEENPPVNKAFNFNKSIKSSHYGRFYMGGAAALICVMLVYLFTINIFSGILFFLSLSGLMVSFFSIYKSVGLQSKFINRFCSTLKYVNCDKVLGSEQGSIFNIAYTDLSLAHFLTLSLVGIFSFADRAIYSIYLLLMPIIGIVLLSSIYLQLFKIKKICSLCMLIIFISIAQLIIFVTQIDFSINLINVLYPSTLFILFVWGIGVVKELINGFQRLQFESIVKYPVYKSFDTFRHFLSQEMVLAQDDFAALTKIEFTQHSGNNITFLLSTACISCKKSYITFRKILYYYQHDIGIQLIIVEDQKDLNSMINAITSDPQVKLEILDDYFLNNTDYDTWLSKWFPGTEIVENVINHAILTEYQMYDFPAVLVNRQRFPDKYFVEDIILFLTPMIKEGREGS